jgi:hypothetical protein
MEEQKRGMRKTSGWLLVVFGLFWGATVLVADQRNGTDISSTLGGVTVPILVSLVGFYFAGIIKSAK